MKHSLSRSDIATYLKDVRDSIATKVNESHRQIKTFGIIFFINYPLYYFIWKFGSIQSYENLFIRILASIFCIPLIFCDKLSIKFSKYLPVYWYFSTMFCLPFFFFFMTLHNHGSAAWLLNLLLEIFLTFLLFDVMEVIIINTIGFTLAWFIYDFIGGNMVVFAPSTIDMYGILGTVAATFVIGSIFVHNKDLIEKEKLQTMKALGATVAHELRTPLVAIQFGISGAKEYFPTLVKGYIRAQSEHKDIEPIKEKHLKILAGVFDAVESEIKYANTIINMILMNVKQNQILTADFQILSMNACIEETIDRYPFKQGEIELIEWSKKDDFYFKGDKTLIIHVLFNLMKNAFYFIEVAGKGKIQIWYESHDNNILYFKDTAKGIPENVIPKLFEKFYTTTRHGTGLGLTFCKMAVISFGGTIDCKSKYGEFTQFELSFPKIANEQPCN